MRRWLRRIFRHRTHESVKCRCGTPVVDLFVYSWFFIPARAVVYYEAQPVVCHDCQRKATARHVAALFKLREDVEARRRRAESLIAKIYPTDN